MGRARQPHLLQRRKRRRREVNYPLEVSRSKAQRLRRHPVPPHAWPPHATAEKTHPVLPTAGPTRREPKAAAPRPELPPSGSVLCDLVRRGTTAAASPRGRPSPPRASF